MNFLLAQTPASDQYGGINAESLPNTGSSLYIIVMIGIICLVTGFLVSK